MNKQSADTKAETALAVRIPAEMARDFEADCAACHRTKSDQLRWLIAERLKLVRAEKEQAAAA